MEIYFSALLVDSTGKDKPVQFGTGAAVFDRYLIYSLSDLKSGFELVLS